MNKEIIDYIDIWYRVEYSWEDRDSDDFAGLNFIAYKIDSLKENNEGIEVPCEISKDKSLEGTIKFDGCMNVKLEEGYAHFCGRHITNQYGELFNRIYDKAKEIGCDE